MLGIENRYTIGLRDYAVFAAANGSFAKAEKLLHKYCDIKIAANTIKALCDAEAPKMQEWQENHSQSWSDFVESEGEVEFTTDGTCVNTTEGWKEMRVGIFAKRALGESVHPDQWAKRKLPKPHVSIAFAAFEEKDKFRCRWRRWIPRLQCDDGNVSVLADGAVWIWDAVLLEFGKVRECLDVYHALEHLSATGKVLYGDGTKEYEEWREATTLELMWNGFELIEGRLDILDQVERPPAEHESLRLLRGYLDRNRDRLCYRERLSEGRAIGSGQVEGACKNLIGARLKQTGAKWKRTRANRMGTICAILYGDQWDNYWKHAK